MTPELLQLLVFNFPNGYELGELIRKFYFFHKDHKESYNLLEIEDLFIKTHITKKINFQKIS